MPLKPCKENQVRNPLTGRCKKVSIIPNSVDNKVVSKKSTSKPTKKPTPKPCKPGQVRNPVTGRCKKVEPGRIPDVIPTIPAPKVQPVTQNNPKLTFNNSRKFNINLETDSDVCINHALALVEGNTMEGVITREESTLDHWMNDGKAFFPEIFLAMMNKKRKPFPKYMFSYFGNVSGHSTIINCFSPDTKNATLFYYDPSSGSAAVDILEWRRFENDFKDKDWYKRISNTTDIRKAIKYYGFDNVPDDIFMDLPGRLIYFFKHVISAWKNSNRYKEIKDKFDVWRRIRDEEDFVELGEENSMSALYILSQLLNADHITVASIYDSMKIEGPQAKFNDGSCPLNRNREENICEVVMSCSNWGSCVVWSSIYVLHTEGFSREVDNAKELMTFMKNNPLVGERSAIDLLSKAMALNFNSNKSFGPFLEDIFEVIPEFDDEDDKNEYIDGVFEMFRDFSFRLKEMDAELSDNLRKRFLENVSERKRNISSILESWKKMVNDKKNIDSKILAAIMAVISCKYRFLFPDSRLR